MKSVIIARVSTEEQKDAGNSLPAQIERMRSYCDRKSFAIIKDFSFDESAYKKERNTFDELLKYIITISKSEKIAVCFDKVDRLSRSVFDKRVSELYEMALAEKIELHFVSDGQIINNQMSAVEKFQFGISLGLAKYYSDAISDNVKRALEQKRRNGEWTGKAPLGYLNGKNRITERPDIVVNQKIAHLIREIFELYATGYSMERVRTIITEKGLRSDAGNKLSKSMIENILKNPFYYGVAYSKKVGEYPHKYEPIITHKLWLQVQEVRTGKKTKPFDASRKEYIFGGLMTCDICGCSMTAELKKGRYIYYSCTNSKGICKRIYVAESTLLERVYEVLDAFSSITDDVQERLLKQLRKNTENMVTYRRQQVGRIQGELEKNRNMLDKLLEKYLGGDDGITKEDYDRMKKKYEDKLKVLEVEMSENTKGSIDYQSTVATIVSLCRRSRELFDSSEVGEKTQIINYVFQNLTVNEKTPCFTMRSPFDLMFELASSPDLLPR